MKKIVILATIISSMVTSMITPAFAASFDDLTSYQKQKYWAYMDDCLGALQAKQYSEYKSCALNVMDKAYNTSISSAWCTSSNNNTPDYFKKDVIKTDLNPSGIEDHVYEFPDGSLYVMEGFCNSENRYAYYQKNCTEIGQDYFADKATGTCMKKNKAPIVTPMDDQYVLVGKTIGFNVMASDPDGDAIVGYDILTVLPAGAAFDKATGAFTFTPTPESADTKFALSFTATDGKSSSAQQIINIIVYSDPKTPQFTFKEAIGSPKVATIGQVITKEFTIKNMDKMRFIIVEVAPETATSATKKYIPISWVSLPDGSSLKIEPNTAVTIKVNITIPPDISPEQYILFMTGIMKNFGGSGCSAGVCMSAGIGIESPLMITQQ